MKHYSYITQGTCSRQIDIDVDDNGCVQNVSFMGGCQGPSAGHPLRRQAHQLS